MRVIHVEGSVTDTDRDGKHGAELIVRSWDYDVLFAVMIYPAFGFIQLGKRKWDLW